jgi:purine-binding chemotaxis protein CheW
MTHELIALRASGQEFCLDVKSVREIRGWTSETPLPRAPDYFRGVINLRGTVLPIVDLGRRLGFPPAKPTARHAILVVETGCRMVGLLVDAVSDIFVRDEKDVQDVPDVDTVSTREFIKGLIADGDRLVSLLDVANILPAMQLAA